MTLQPFLSIIIPVYNAEAFLRQSLDSILSQTFSDFELVLVDDGSKDNSGIICDEYSQSEVRVKVVHKQNAGASEARNTGIEQSSAELICFIDADDVISPDYIQQLIDDYSKALDVDFVIQGMIQKWPDYNTVFKMSDGIYDLSSSEGYKFFEEVKINDFSGPYCKIYRRSILNQYNIRFSKGIIYAEDFDFLLRYLMHCQTVIASSATNYYYLMHGGSVSSKIYDFDKEISGLQHLYESYNKILLRFYSQTLEGNYRKAISAYIWRVIYSNYRYAYTRSERIANFKKFRPEFISYMSSQYVSTSLFTRIVKSLISKRFFSLLDVILNVRLTV